MIQFIFHIFLFAGLSGFVNPLANAHVLTFTFSGTHEKQLLLLQTLNDYQLKSTVYVNGFRIGLNEAYMSISDVNSLQTQNHEIGSSGFKHKSLLDEPLSVQYSDICVNRGFLDYHGWNSSSYFYPYNDIDIRSNQILLQVVKECGYNSGQSQCDKGENNINNLGAELPTICSRSFQEDFLTVESDVLRVVDEIIEQILPSIANSSANSTSEPSLPQSPHLWFILNFDRVCNLPNCITNFRYFLDSFVLHKDYLQIMTIHQVIGGSFIPVPEEYTWTVNAPKPFFQLGFLVGLGLMGGIALVIITYMTYTGCIRYRKTLDKKKKEMAIMEQMSLQSEMV